MRRSSRPDICLITEIPDDALWPCLRVLHHPVQVLRRLLRCLIEEELHSNVGPWVLTTIVVRAEDLLSVAGLVSQKALGSAAHLTFLAGFGFFQKPVFFSLLDGFRQHRLQVLYS